MRKLNAEIVKLVMKELKKSKEKYGVDPVIVEQSPNETPIISAEDMVCGVHLEIGHIQTAIPTIHVDKESFLMFKYVRNGCITYLQIDTTSSDKKDEVVFDYNTIRTSDGSGSSIRRRMVTYSESSDGFLSKSEKTFLRKSGVRYDTVVVVSSDNGDSDSCVRTLDSTEDPMVFKKVKSNEKIDFTNDPNTDLVLKKFLTEELLDTSCSGSKTRFMVFIYRSGTVKVVEYTI